MTPPTVREVLAVLVARMDARLAELSRPAHTYASENADVYRAFDSGVMRCREAWEAETAGLRSVSAGEVVVLSGRMNRTILGGSVFIHDDGEVIPMVAVKATVANALREHVGKRVRIVLVEVPDGE